MAVSKQAQIKGHSLIVIEILKEEKFRKFAEIGVWKSQTTKRILRNIPEIEEYWAIDPWDFNLAHSRTEKRRSEQNWFEMYNYACSLMIYLPQLRVVRMLSELASEIIPDSYFDMVYIDARHTYDHVKADIGYWLPKVREGGLIGGHDYGSRRWVGVKKAVDEWFGKDGIKVVS